MSKLHLSDERHVSSSTSNILNKISGMATEDHPESFQRKKKDNERIFDEICYFIFMEELRINNELIFFLQKMEELLYEETESYLFALSQKALNAIQFGMDKVKLVLSEAQQLRLQELNQTLNHLIETLGKKIKEYGVFIVQQKEKVSELENELKAIQSNCSNKWIECFDSKNIKDHFQDIAIPMTILSEKFQQLLRNKQDQLVVFDYEMYLQLGKEIGEEIKKGNISLLNISEIIEDKVMRIIKNKLQEDLSYLTIRTRDELITEAMASPAMQALVAGLKKSALLNAMNEPSLIEDMRRANILEKEIAEINTKIAVFERKRDHLLMLASELTSAKEMVNEISSHSQRQEDTNATTDKSISSLESLVNNLLSESEKIDSKLDEKSMQCNLILASGDDAIDGLNVILRIADECKNNDDGLKGIADGLEDLTHSYTEDFNEMFATYVDELKTEGELAKIQSPEDKIQLPEEERTSTHSIK